MSSWRDKLADFFTSSETSRKRLSGTTLSAIQQHSLREVEGARTYADDVPVTEDLLPDQEIRIHTRGPQMDPCFEGHDFTSAPPAIPAEFLPRHIALVMDGNGRWAQQRGMTRTEGHRRGEAVLLEACRACLEAGVPWLSAYAFSTENWTRSYEEVRFLMSFSRDVLRWQRDELNEMGVRIHWAGRRPRLWPSVIKELEIAEELTQHNDNMHLVMCVNYGGRAEITDAANRLAMAVKEGVLDPCDISEKTLSDLMYVPEMPDVDLFLRPSGEKRTSNFLLWQSAYAEMVYQDVLFPDFDRSHLWAALDEYARRDRRFGGVKTPKSGELKGSGDMPKQATGTDGGESPPRGTVRR